MPWRILVIHLYCQWGLIISSQKLLEMISYLPKSLPKKEYWCFQGKALEEADTSESPSVLKRKPLKNPSRGLKRSKIFSNPDNLRPKWRFQWSQQTVSLPMNSTGGSILRLKILFVRKTSRTLAFRKCTIGYSYRRRYIRSVRDEILVKCKELPKRLMRFSLTTKWICCKLF